jgi:NNP family nitrate/nitrite transporter-like MFS transporter
MIVVAAGWQMVPKVYSIAMLIMAIVFWVFTYNDPLQEERKRTGKHKPLSDQLAPLKELRVWRFGLYYYFVFGGFVSLALWLPKYYVGEYGMDIKTASFITIIFTLPSGIIRALGGYMSDKVGARVVNWWVFWVSASALFFLSYPNTSFIIHGMEGDMAFDINIGPWAFTALVFVVGIAMGIGKASVYRILHDYYPDNMGAVGGMVGVLGGLGGFTLPIFYGLLSDFTNIRTSCFMLLFGLVATCMIWMNYSILQLNKESDFLGRT